MEKTNNMAGKLFLCLIGVMLMIAGGAFEWLMIRSYSNAKATREWPQVEAVVLRSVVDERQIKGSPPEFRFSVLYGYSYEGDDLTSDKLAPRGSKWSKSDVAAEGLTEKYPAGSEHPAWVNPEDSSVCILQHDTKAAGYTLWFPALIIVGGAGMIWGAFRKPKERQTQSVA